MVKKPVYVIAEIGINHNGDMERARFLIDAAKAAGADAAKFQSFKTELLIRPTQEKMPYQQINDVNPETQFEMLKRVELTREQHVDLMAYCKKVGIDFFSTPYDNFSALMLKEIGSDRLKVASTDTTNLPFLRYLVSLGLEIILSTGVTEMDELRQVMKSLKPKFPGQIKLLHCVSNYPAPLHEINLKVIEQFKEEFQCSVGFSDHTDDLVVGGFAVMAGAEILEKHFTFDKNAPGPDHKASLLPDELKIYVDNIRKAEKCLGDGIKKVTASEREIKRHMQKSLVANGNLPSGKVITEEDLWAMRPAEGISPLKIDSVVGKKLTKPVTKFAPIQWENLQ